MRAIGFLLMFGLFVYLGFLGFTILTVEYWVIFAFVVAIAVTSYIEGMKR
jgi:hypothetical protein